MDSVLMAATFLGGVLLDIGWQLRRIAKALEKA